MATQFTGACPERSRGKPFGKPSPTTSSYPYLFAGMEYDNATGLYHTRARYYSPVLERFLSEDPLRHGAGVNFFSYAGNDPVNGTDPLGLWITPGGDVNGPNGIPDFGGTIGFNTHTGTEIGDPVAIDQLSTTPIGGSGCNFGNGCHITLPAQVGGPFWGRGSGIIIAQEDKPGGPIKLIPGDSEGGGGISLQPGEAPVPEVAPEEAPPPAVPAGNLKTLSKNQLRGIDAEKFKNHNVGRTAGGKFNIAVAPNGDVYLVPAQPGSGPPVPTGYSIDELNQLYAK